MNTKERQKLLKAFKGEEFEDVSFSSPRKIIKDGQEKIKQTSLDWLDANYTDPNSFYTFITNMEKEDLAGIVTIAFYTLLNIQHSASVNREQIYDYFKNNTTRETSKKDLLKHLKVLYTNENTIGTEVKSGFDVMLENYLDGAVPPDLIKKVKNEGKLVEKMIKVTSKENTIFE